MNPVMVPEEKKASLMWVYLACLMTTAPVWTAQAQAPCSSRTLDRAVDTYDFGRFEQTFDLLGPCLPDGFPQKADRVQAFRLMALAYIAIDSLEQARQWVRRLLRADGRFRPDPDVDPPRFAGLVRDLKPRWYTWLWKGNAWYKWAGRGVLAAGVVSLPLLLRGSKPPPELPGSPALPPR